MMKATAVEGIDPISGRRQINAMWLMPPGCVILVMRGLWGPDTLTENPFSIPIPLINRGKRRKI